MGKDNYNFECPFCECYDIVCNLNELKDGKIMCPEQLRIKCQADMVPTKEDILIVNETWNKLREAKGMV